MGVTSITETEREFLNKLHALCVEYGVSLYGDAEQYYPSFGFSIGDNRFHTLTVNDSRYDDYSTLITSVANEYDGPLILHSRQRE